MLIIKIPDTDHADYYDRKFHNINNIKTSIGMVELMSRTIEKLEKVQPEQLQQGVFVGFDGFVDKIIHPVKNKDKTSVNYYETLTDFAERIAFASGKSAQVELAIQEIKMGGNGPILANALARLGARTTCMCTMGYPAIQPVFQPIADACDVFSLGEPAVTNALEFDDGKLMLSDFSPFHDLNWAYIDKKFGREKILEKLDACRTIALVDWSNLIHATDIWKGVLDHILPWLSKKERHFYFDLCDPNAQSDEEIKEMLEVVSAYSQYGQVTLGINVNELMRLYKVYSGGAYPEEKTLAENGQYLFDQLTIDHLLIHPIERTLAVSKDGVTDVEGRIIPEPKILTGGGDNLNAGYCLGQMLGMELDECLFLGTATAGAYIQNGHSPDLQEIIDYLKFWKSLKVTSRESKVSS